MEGVGRDRAARRSARLYKGSFFLFLLLFFSVFFNLQPTSELTPSATRRTHFKLAFLLNPSPKNPNRSWPHSLRLITPSIHFHSQATLVAKSPNHEHHRVLQPSHYSGTSVTPSSTTLATLPALCDGLGKRRAMTGQECCKTHCETNLDSTPNTKP